MKKYFLIAVSLLIITKGWAQNSNLNYKYAIKLYNLTTYDELSTMRRVSNINPFHDEYKYTYLKILNPAFAIQWKTDKNNFDEIELTHFLLGKNNTQRLYVNDSTSASQQIYEQEQISTSISLRYEYILNFNKKKDKKYGLSLGFGINPYFTREKYNPKSSTSFPSSDQIIGFNLFVTPRFTYYLSQRLFVDVNIPLCISNSNLQTTVDKNPGLPENQRKTNTINFEEIPKIYSFRIGVGIKL